MSLSKARDRERKRLIRLESGVVTPGRLFSPSKFLSEEADLKVEARVREALAGMSGNEIQALRGLASSFVPNKVRNPDLKVP